MALFTDLESQVALLRRLLGADATAERLPDAMTALGDDDLVATICAAAALVRGAERIGIVGAGLVAARSQRQAGQSGLAQSRGHRNAISLVQELTGASRADASCQVRLGEALFEQLSPGEESGDGRFGGDRSGSVGGEASGGYRSGFGSSETAGGYGSGGEDAGSYDTTDAGKADAAGDSGAGFGADGEYGFAGGYGITDGDGFDGGDAGGHGFDDNDAAGSSKPAGPGDTGGPGGNRAGSSAGSRPWHAPLSDALLRGHISADQPDAILRGLGDPPDPTFGMRDAWATAAEQLIAEAAQRTVEELRAAARSIRDRLDPDGAERRYQQRLDKRAFRMWTDPDGVRHGHITFDDEGASWTTTIFDAALRPRRGGPRFVDPHEKTTAAHLAQDPRTNDQLAYDLLIDLLRTGSLADPSTVFGTRQAGLRLVRVTHDDSGSKGLIHTDDGLHTLPAWIGDQHTCNTGTRTVIVDKCGNPLDVGREERLFTPRQRLALATRDGGCRWPGCDRPSSYCEAHHIDPYSQGGRTDIDRGILLCRFHHQQLHHTGWYITRRGKDDFVLHHPDGESIVLAPRLALTYAWAGIDPPAPRFNTG